MKAKLFALVGSATLLAAPALAGGDIYIDPAYDPDFHALDTYPVPYPYPVSYAVVPPPDVAELYVTPPYAPPVEAYAPPPIEDYETGPAIVIGD